MPIATREQVLQCSAHKWLPKIKQNCGEYEIIELDASFIEYLNQDGIQLPSDMEKDFDQYLNIKLTLDRIQQVFNKFSNVFPKLNWSSPKDACWINHNQSPKCSTVDDIIQMLKASDCINFDLNHIFDECTLQSEAYQNDQILSDDDIMILKGHLRHLILKRFDDNIVPSMEFRCIVHHGTLVGISQRYLGVCYNYTQEELVNICQTIIQFHQQELNGALQNLDDYVFDVCLMKENAVRLIDINPVSDSTDLALFASSNNEIESLVRIDPQLLPILRVHRSDAETSEFQSSNPRYQLNMLPVDAFQLHNQQFEFPDGFPLDR
ncbi:hypothetical protein MIR68_003250 [Amoeboaphelidium protococcarum]|nr:hypothetical protein MIR68_003250 [Amoeboaphelidium protococcarum]